MHNPPQPTLPTQPTYLAYLHLNIHTHFHINSSRPHWFEQVWTCLDKILQIRYTVKPNMHAKKRNELSIVKTTQDDDTISQINKYFSLCFDADFSLFEVVCLSTQGLKPNFIFPIIVVIDATFSLFEANSLYNQGQIFVYFFLVEVEEPWLEFVIAPSTSCKVKGNDLIPQFS